MRLAGPLDLEGQWVHRSGNSCDFLSPQPGANRGSHRTFLSLLLAGNPPEYCHILNAQHMLPIFILIITGSMTKS